jgi:methylmalonyl-CoA mutase cobalamin-binding subunit
MSKFVDKLQSLSRSSTAPMGFHAAVSDVRSPAMLLVVGLSGTQVKEAKVVAEVQADAGLIVSEGTSAKAVGQVVEAVGNVPLGVFVKGMNEKEIDELVSLGCDFVVFDVKAAGGILSKKEVGKFLTVEPSLDQGLVRAINRLEVDGVFISTWSGDSFVAVEHLLVCRRFVELLEKPVMIALPSLATKEELTSLWQGGVDGVVSPLTQSAQALAELKKRIGDLPRGARGKRPRAGVMLPRYGEGVVGDENEEQEEDLV